MAITEKELEISNKSYTNKDFKAIYNELLGYAESLSERFSPTESNESDPFVLLLKLMAFVSDKINYNVDKNILERFILSCTQEQSMRELTEMLGYDMHYYRSAETSVLFKYLKEEKWTDEIIIPQFSILTSRDEKIQYITTRSAIIDRNTKTSTEVDVIQGRLKVLSILGVEEIQLENLTPEHRLYFPEKMIAENGIWITSSVEQAPWKKVTNLNVQNYGAAVYKFGYDSKKNLPYVEFPEWIASIIGKGLSVKYLVTNGKLGNVSARDLLHVSRIDSMADIGVKDEDIVVTNYSAATSGIDPESIEESYNGFKKVIGTFDTLVTCRDYANKIFTLLDNYKNPLVSNVQVSDRRTDINYGSDVVSLNENGQYTGSIISRVPANAAIDSPEQLETPSPENVGQIKFCIKDGTIFYYRCDKIVNPAGTESYAWTEQLKDNIKPIISPFDLCVYGMKPISNFANSAVNEEYGYNDSFKYISTDPATQPIESIKLLLDDSKTITHDFKSIAPSAIAGIHNNYQLNGIVSTVGKVSILEEKDILANINNALIKKYNSRELTFGSEIAFDELLNTIETADPRIKSVGLQEPIQVPRVVLMDNSEKALQTYSENDPSTIVESSPEYKSIVAKNIFAGKVSAFNYDNEFNYSYSYKNMDKIDKVGFITTTCNIEEPIQNSETTTNAYKLKSNEVIQFIAPNLVSLLTYGAGVKYYLKLADPDRQYIAKDANYTIKPGDELVITFKDENDQLQVTEFKQGEIISPNFDFFSTEARLAKKQTPSATNPFENSAISTKYADGKTYKFFIFGPQDQLTTKGTDEEHIRTFKKCYWLTKNLKNKIEWKTEIYSDPVTKESKTFYTYLLGEDEYFFYTESTVNTLTIYGSGTKLVLDTINPANANVDLWQHETEISVNDINKKGLDALQDLFIDKKFSPEFQLSIIQNEIITLVAGDSLQVKFGKTAEQTTTNEDNTYKIENNEFGDFKDKENNPIPFKDLEIKYKLQADDNLIPLPDRSGINDARFMWKARAVLDLNCGPDLPQTVEGKQKILLYPARYNSITNEYEKITLNDNNIETIYIEVDQPGYANAFMLNLPLQRSGGVDLELAFKDISSKHQLNCPSGLSFTVDTNSFPDLILSDDNFYGLNFSQCDGKVIENSDPIHCDVDKQLYTSIDVNESREIPGYQKAIKDIHDRYFMVYVAKVEPGINIKVHANIETSESKPIPTLALVNTLDKSENQFDLSLKSGMNIIKISDNKGIDENSPDPKNQRFNITKSVFISARPEGSNIGDLVEGIALENVQKTLIYISPLKVVVENNQLLGLGEHDDIITYMKTNYPEQFLHFYLLNEIENSKQIEISDTFKLNSAQAFYDSNNIANKWVLPKIDFANSNITIAHSSKKPRGEY